MPHRNPEPLFDGNGFGPFTVERKELRSTIVVDLCKGNGWKGTVHISSAKGSGKTTLLQLIGEDLLNGGETVYFFRNSRVLDSVLHEIEALDEALDKRVIFLVDESQESVGSHAFTFLLKCAKKITTIGAGVPAYKSISGNFRTPRNTPDLFLNQADLKKEGVLDYFVGGDTQSEAEVSKWLSHLCWHTGGHVYPLMRLSELLVPKIKKEDGMSAEECISFYESLDFRKTTEFQEVCQRILPDIETYDIMQLFNKNKNRDYQAQRRLQRAGFCNQNGKIISNLLIEAHFASMGTEVDVITDLQKGVKGIQQLLRIGLPHIEWDQYEGHGGAIEDCLTFELMLAVRARVHHSTQLFCPALVEAGHRARKPDMFFNSVVNSYVEALLTHGNTSKSRTSLDEHISRFYKPQEDKDPYYKLQQGRDFAILHFQNWGGDHPLQPNATLQDAFQERVFTFIMPTKALFLGNTRIDEVPLAVSSS